MPKCSTCKYIASGSCTRFPVWTPVEPDLHYCGEHKPKQAAKKSDYRVKELITHYEETFRTVFGAEPLVNHAVEAPLAKRLLSSYTLDECKWIVTEYLNRPPEFYRKNGLKAFKHIVSAVKNGHVIDRMGGRKQSLQQFIAQQIEEHCEDDDLGKEYESFVRSTNERMGFTDWVEEFK